jgi:hypothetical protein
MKIHYQIKNNIKENSCRIQDLITYLPRIMQCNIYFKLLLVNFRVLPPCMPKKWKTNYQARVVVHGVKSPIRASKYHLRCYQLLHTLQANIIRSYHTKHAEKNTKSGQSKPSNHLQGRFHLCIWCQRSSYTKNIQIAALSRIDRKGYNKMVREPSPTRCCRQPCQHTRPGRHGRPERKW